MDLALRDGRIAVPGERRREHGFDRLLCSRPLQRGYDNPVFATMIALRDQWRGSDERSLDVRERLDGATAVVTGGNRGLGRAIAQGLGARGARVILPCRGEGAAALADVRRAGGDGELRYVDLADLDTVHRLADSLRASTPIEVLVLNAGIVPGRSRATRQGFEIQIGVNYLANVLLVKRLIDDGTLAPRARVIAVSSESHRSATRIDLAGLGVADDYGMRLVMARYSYSKLLLTVWAAELARRTELTVHTICPGPVASGIAREAPRWSQPLLGPVMRAFFAPPHVAARPVVFLACARALAGESLYFHRFEEKAPSALALDATLGARLYDESIALLESRAPHPDPKER